MFSIGSSSGINRVPLPTNSVQTPETNRSSPPPPVGFPADDARQVARGMPSKVCIGDLRFQVGPMKAALNNIAPNQAPTLDEDRMFSYLADYSDPLKNTGKMVVSGELDNLCNLSSLTAMHASLPLPLPLPPNSQLAATTERPVFEPVVLFEPLNYLRPAFTAPRGNAAHVSSAPAPRVTQKRGAADEQIEGELWTMENGKSRIRTRDEVQEALHAINLGARTGRIGKLLKDARGEVIKKGTSDEQIMAHLKNSDGNWRTVSKVQEELHANVLGARTERIGDVLRKAKEATGGR